ncbi:MAG: LysM peptidoglycan-binding domain-containing protein [Candidatus Saccharicenans sp.]|jgi:LysM repeat protein|nr:LysM peptidoglycan-binding domain-containing protein [Candidatus Saccharicenans sp.]MDH7575088.1 LysM peptidoglycan-binding domain-containing protein [Candidatus Saccharicenans sp.]
MGIFGKSFSEKVQEAVDIINRSGIGVENLRAKIEGKVVTLEGLADSMEAKGRAMLEFNKMVNTENTINRIQVKAEAKAPSPPGATLPGPAAATDYEIYEVKPGDTLGHIAQRFYGKASLYPKIFEANRDVLTNPDLIKVGQKLKIPRLK